MLATILSVQVLALVHGVCITGSTRTCKLTGCATANQICQTDRTWGPCGCNCSDQNACTADSWSGTQCVHAPVAVEDDHNPCTADSCDPTLGMRHTPLAAGTSCSDGNACNGAETCNASGVCAAGTPILVDDGNACTVDSCDPNTGEVTHAPTAVGSSCSDGNYCNGFETCDGLGACLGGLPPTVDDGNSCTADSCDPATGVWNVPVAEGTSCADATVCNGAETCNASGTCASGAALVVDDHDPCTGDTCDPVTGVSHTWIAGCTYTPPDPATLATPLSRTAVTSFADSVAFLYSGSTPIQLGVDPSVFDATRVAVVRGIVSDADGAPVPGARVSILDHPEYGRTYTRADGRFDLAVNGGGSLPIEYWREGYLPSQRTIQPVWNEYSSVADVILLPYDPRSTVVALGAAGTQVASGSPVTDTAGSRQVMVLIPPNTQAGMALPNGTTQPLSSMTIRATEYTANRPGTKAMPGELPPASGYTYAVELGADEATLAGATDIEFNQPVPFYVDNFLRFPVGGAVPTGYYDRTKAKWLPSADGRVIKVLAIAEGAAEIDVDGTGTPADVAKLAALGITSDELVQLAQLYAAGKELWRARVTHFTPWDCNWPVACRGACPEPNAPPPPPHDPDPCQTATAGSIIECQGQTLGENIPLVGTSLRLHYQSDRVPGFTRSIEIPLTGSTAPASTLLNINVTVRIAGQVSRQQFAPPFTADQRWTFIWDGRDAYGRLVIGGAIAQIDLSYDYGSVYLAPDGSWSFGALPTTMVQYASSALPAFPVTRTQSFTTFLGTWDQRSTGIGGWSLSPHHHYDPAASALYLGTGSRRRGEDLPGIISTVAGGGSSIEDGRRATEASLQLGSPLTVGPDGSVYATDTPIYGTSRVRRIAPDGLIWTVAGTNSNCIESGEGISATRACFVANDIALGPDGALYISDFHVNTTNSTYVSRILKMGSDGLIHTFAGAGAPGATGDGGPATQAQIDRTYGIAFGPDGSLYLLSTGRLRKVDPSGTITTVAGNGSCSSSFGDGGPARQARFCASGKLAIGTDGSIFLPDTTNQRLRKITSDGIIRTIAGTGALSPSGDGGSAMNAGIGYIYGVALARDGSIFLGEDYTYGTYTHARIRKVAPDGTISTISGGSPAGYAGDGGAAASAQLHSPRGLASNAVGLLYVADVFNNRIRRIAPPPLSSLGGSYLVPSDEGEHLYVFDREGRHLQTIDARTNVSLYSFQYDPSGWLSTITDRNGLVTTVERDGAGIATAIVAPYGQRTVLTYDSNGYLASVTNPANEAVNMTYDDLGLMSTFTDPRDGVHTFSFTSGRLTGDANPAGGAKQLVRKDGSDTYQVQLTTAFDATRDLVSFYNVQRLGTGERVSTDTAPDGTQRVTRFSTNGGTVATLPDGTTFKTTEQPDPRLGMMAPLVSTTTTAPSGLQRTVSHTRSVALADTTNLLSLTQQIDTQLINGRSWVTTYDAAARTQTSQSPAGRTTVVLLDAQGRVVEMRPPGYSSGLAAGVQYSYDAKGRLYSATRGSRSVSVGYDGQGYAASFTDPLQRTIHAWYDPAGRLIDQELLGSRHVTYGYDRNGNLTSVTPSGRPSHAFEYTPADLTASYTPPLVEGAGLLRTAYGYMLDGSLAQVLMPDEGTVTYGYDAAGRLASITPAFGTMTVGYDAAGRLGSITVPDGGEVSFGYDGFLKTTETWTGAVAGTIGYAYDSDLRVGSITVDGTLASYQYDPDGLLIQAGAVTINRHAVTGWITGTTTGQVTTSQSMSQYGELGSFSAKANGTDVFSYTLDRDAAGRIFRKTETIGGTTSVYGYDYDAAGRLWTVSRNGTAVSIYTYDANGNRLSGPVAQTGTYDDQDRMLAYDAATYTYGPNGDLRCKTENGQTTSYTYDALGNLVATSLPDGTLIEYVIDGQNRRIGKKLNGQLVEGFLYEGQLRPVAWLNGTGQVYARFVYGTHVNVPEYIVTAGGTFRVVTDHLGSPRLIVDTATGMIAQRIDYDEWGNVLQDTAPGFQPFGFAGGLYDRDTDLIRFGARDYDPQSGRWTHKDPIRFAGGAANLYAYAMNDPVNTHDPAGLYGTSYCGYYGQACAANGGFYECNVAPAACNAFPHETSDWGDEADLPIESQEAHAVQDWAACVRQCLQERHRDRMPHPTQCSEDNNIPRGENVSEHAECMTSCGEDPENPYSPGGPPLPDAEILLWK